MKHDLISRTMSIRQANDVSDELMDRLLAIGEQSRSRDVEQTREINKLKGIIKCLLQENGIIKEKHLLSL